MDEEKIKPEIHNKDLFFEGKMALQSLLVASMLEKGASASTEDKLDWTTKYAKKYADYITNPQNEIIRDLIIENSEESRQEALAIMLKVLKDEKVVVGV